MKPYIDALQNYAVFAGRTSIGDYWNFVAINMFFLLVGGLVTDFLGLRFVGVIYYLALVLPSISIGVRRMHDVDKSGWYLLVPFYGFILAVTEGTRGENQFGPEPSREAQLP